VRVVLDTNVVVSALVFREGRLSWLRDAWKSGTLVPVLDAACADELIRVLAYPRFRLSPDDVSELLGDYLPWTELVESEPPADPALPECRDPADRKFLVLAAAAGVDALVTGDEALLELRADGFEILSPAKLKARLE
jgi:putative PIN family toxin of toxin-antitoxin system